MTRVVGASILGALVGGVLLAIVAAIGPDPAVTIPIPQANGTVRPETISLASIVSRIAIILGVCTGALVGGLAGAARPPNHAPPLPRQRVRRNGPRRLGRG